MELEKFMQGLMRRNPGQTEFHQAVKEVAMDLIPFINKNPKYEEARVLERLTEPDRIITFRVCWLDDNNNVRVNRGYRVQHSNAIGPYKGGLRFDKSVSLSILKFLAFEQTFKNSLTSLPMGGGKGGADFNPKGKSDNEVMRFCYSFMTELQRHIGKDIDIPAGDIGVGAREIGYMYGQFLRISNTFTGTLTGKGGSFGGSEIRTEATGYGCVYFAREMLKTIDEELEGKKCIISGAGNVALYAAEKLIQEGAKVITLSDRSGFIHVKDGLTEEQLKKVMEIKVEKHGSLEDFANEDGCDYHKDAKPWGVDCDLAFPCATQNELEEKDARALIGNKCQLVCEGANMPSTQKAAEYFLQSKILYGPSKAANAGGVAISGMEMAQNSRIIPFSRQEVDEKLKQIMKDIHEKCVRHGKDGNGKVNYVKGSNIAGFLKVSDALMKYGVL
jgi:glutamate dehydrogenase (NADP+)